MYRIQKLGRFILCIGDEPAGKFLERYRISFSPCNQTQEK